MEIISILIGNLFLEEENNTGNESQNKLN